MDRNEKPNVFFKETCSGFPFGNFQRMSEMMSKCCEGISGISDCCLIMDDMSGKARGENKTEKSKKEKA